ncbi:DUF1642 domain-containing protein [Listeria monocytogenes]|uniref:DUF1642 domain-containing protein n=1 Tax=Listeria monocytogenes TaxID=1639 RepID=UPI0010F082A6|nr:DUF1642 domain-containing protein [Listeria monocytogenes]EAC8432163.1 DUF1642 domain-containing protein [Listeria monocytogenes]
MIFKAGDKVEFIYRNKKSVGVINGVYPEKQAVEVIVNGCLNVSFPDKAIAKVEEQERVVVPQCVADWIEQKKSNGDQLYIAMDKSWQSMNYKVSDWLEEGEDRYNKFARAWLDGYEVKKEPLYYVRLPFASRSTDFEKETTYTYIIVNITTDEMQPSTSNRNYGSWKAALTESEIKAMPGGDIYWQFAEPVEVEAQE